MTEEMSRAKVIATHADAHWTGHGMSGLRRIVNGAGEFLGWNWEQAASRIPAEPKAEAAPEADATQKCGHTWNCMVCDECPECEGCEHIDKKVWPESATEGAPETTLTGEQIDSTCNHDPACGCDICNQIRTMELASQKSVDWCHYHNGPFKEVCPLGGKCERKEDWGKPKAEGAEKVYLVRPTPLPTFNSGQLSYPTNPVDAYMDALESRNAELQRKGEELCHVLGGLGIHIHELGLRSVGEMGQWKYRNDHAEKAEREVERLTQQSANVSFNEGVDAAIAFVVGGRFLSDEAPTAQFAREVAENLPRIKRVESSPSAQKEGE